MDWPRVGRFLFATVALLFGVLHLLTADLLSVQAPLPPREAWVYATGLAQIAAAVALYTGKYARPACLLLGLLYVVFALGVHLVGLVGGDLTQIDPLLKALGMAAGALGLSALFASEKTA